MSTLSSFISWDAGCTFHSCNLAESGLRGWHFDYTQPFPCPNGLGINYKEPRDEPAWVARVAKARRDAIAWDAECRIRVMADSITREELLNDIEEIGKWAQSLKQVPV